MESIIGNLLEAQESRNIVFRRISTEKKNKALSQTKTIVNKGLFKGVLLNEESVIASSCDDDDDDDDDSLIRLRKTILKSTFHSNTRVVDAASSSEYFSNKAYYNHNEDDDDSNGVFSESSMQKTTTIVRERKSFFLEETINNRRKSKSTSNDKTGVGLSKTLPSHETLQDNFNTRLLKAKYKSVSIRKTINNKSKSTFNSGKKEIEGKEKQQSLSQKQNHNFKYNNNSKNTRSYHQSSPNISTFKHKFSLHNIQGNNQFTKKRLLSNNPIGLLRPLQLKEKPSNFSIDTGFGFALANAIDSKLLRISKFLSKITNASIQVDSTGSLIMNEVVESKNKNFNSNNNINNINCKIESKYHNYFLDSSKENGVMNSSKSTYTKKEVALNNNQAFGKGNHMAKNTSQVDFALKASSSINNNQETSLVINDDFHDISERSYLDRRKQRSYSYDNLRLFNSFGFKKLFSYNKNLINNFNGNRRSFS